MAAESDTYTADRLAMTAPAEAKKAAEEAVAPGSPPAAEWHPDPVPEREEEQPQSVPQQYVQQQYHQYAHPHPMYRQFHNAVGYGGQAPPGMQQYPQPQFCQPPPNFVQQQQQYEAQNYDPQMQALAIPSPPAMHWQQQQQMMVMMMPIAPVDPNGGGWWQPPPPQQHMPYGHHRNHRHAHKLQSHADNLVGSDPRRWVEIPWEVLESEIVQLAFSKHGSLCLQSKLSVQKVSQFGELSFSKHGPIMVAHEPFLSIVLAQLIPVLDKVMQDKFGSHLTRAIVQLSTSEQRIQMWNSLSGSKIVEASCTHAGKWTVQKLIMAAATCLNIEKSVATMTKPLPTQRSNTAQIPDEFHSSLVELMSEKPACCQVTPDELRTIQSAFSKDDIVTLFCERDGAHIIKTFMLYFEKKDRQFIYDAAETEIMRLSTDRYGGPTLQRCLEAGSIDQKMALAVAITQNALAMVCDAHGNYILQHVLSMSADAKWSKKSKEAALTALRGQFVPLAKHKFGSNVVEKCVQCGEWALVEIIDEIVATKSGLDTLLCDKYGNYVMQSIIQRCDLDGELLPALSNMIGEYKRNHIGWSETVVGRRILQKLVKRLGKREKRMIVAEKEQEALKAVDDLLREDDGEGEGEGEDTGGGATDLLNDAVAVPLEYHLDTTATSTAQLAIADSQRKKKSADAITDGHGGDGNDGKGYKGDLPTPAEAADLALQPGLCKDLFAKRLARRARGDGRDDGDRGGDAGDAVLRGGGSPSIFDKLASEIAISTMGESSSMLVGSPEEQFPTISSWIKKKKKKKPAAVSERSARLSPVFDNATNTAATEGVDGAVKELGMDAGMSSASNGAGGDGDVESPVSSR